MNKNQSLQRFIAACIAARTYAPSTYTQYPPLQATHAAAGAGQEAPTKQLPDYLAHAADQGNIAPFAAYLKQQGGSLEALDKNKMTVLCRAINNQHHHLTAWLLDHGASVKPGIDLNSPLHWAACADPKTVTMLLDRGASVDCLVSDNSLETPLHFVASHLRAEDSRAIIQILLDRGANPHLQNKKGKDSLDLAIGNLTYLSNHGLSNVIESIKILIRWAGILPRHIERLNQAPRALENSYTKMFRRKKTEEKDIPQKIKEETSQALAAIGEVRAFMTQFPDQYRTSVLEPLLHCLKIDIINNPSGIRNEMAQAALVYLEYPTNHTSITDRILKPELTLSLRDPALHTTQQFVRESVQQLDSLGYTPLLLAVYVGNTLAVKELLEHNVPLDMKTRFGYTARSLAHHRYESTLNRAYQEIMTLLDHHETEKTAKKF